MNKSRVIAIGVLLVVVALGGFFVLRLPQQEKGGEIKEVTPTQVIEDVTYGETVTDMTISSSAFDNTGSIPAKYTCDAQDVNPPLNFGDISNEAKSLALIVDDPDAPVGVWNHWLVWNISPDVASIEENSIPEGAVAGKNDFGNNNYGGPCPPSGTHRYRFKLFALDTELDIPETSKQKDVEAAIEGHILGQTTLVGTYGR